MDLMTVVGQRISRPWLAAPAGATHADRLRAGRESLPVLAWPVCWELVSETDGVGSEDDDEACDDDVFLRDAA